MMKIEKRLMEVDKYSENLFTSFLERSIARFCEWNLPWNQRSSFFEKKIKLLTMDLRHITIKEIIKYCPEIYSWIQEDHNYFDKLSVSLLSTRLISEDIASQLTSSLLNSYQHETNLSSHTHVEKSKNDLSEFIQTWKSNGRLKLPPSLIPDKTYQILMQATLNKSKNNETYQTLCNHILLSLISTKFESKIIEEILKDQSKRFDITPIPWKDISILKVQNYLNHVVANNL